MSNKINIEYIPIEDIKPFEKNPKIHTEEQIRLLADSMKRFGFVNPVLINKSNIIIGGHGRVLAAQRLNITHIPSIRLEHLTPEEVDTFRILDNKSGELSMWDETKLAETLRSLDVDLSKLTGFTDSQISSYKNPFDFEELSKEVQQMEEEKLEEVEWKAKIEKKDFDKIKDILDDVKKNKGVSKYYSDYANGQVMISLIEEILSKFKTTSQASGYFEDYENNTSKVNGKLLLDLAKEHVIK